MIGAGHVESLMQLRNSYRILVRKFEGKRRSGDRRSWEDGSKMDLRKIWLENDDRIHMAHSMFQW
jgi:hypothetical protein